MKNYLNGLLILFASIMLFSSCKTKNAIEGYEWLEGEWVGYSQYSEWGKIVVTPNKYKFVYSYNNENIEDIVTAEEKPIVIRIIDNYIEEGTMLALDKDNSIIGIDESRQQLYIILGEYNRLYLQKSEEYFEDATSATSPKNTNELDELKNNNSNVTIQENNITLSLDFSKPYGWKEDNLKGSVKSLEETLLEEDVTSWVVVKKYDTTGRITYFKRNGSDHNMLSTVYPKGFPIVEKMGGINYNAFEEYGRYLNPVHMLGYYASEDKRYFNSGAYTFDYNDKGLVNNVYCDNKLINTCEYDEHGRLVTRYEGGLPTLKIIWNENSNSIKRASFEIKLYNSEGNLIKQISGEWDGCILKVGDKTSQLREYTFMGDELHYYKTNNYGRGYEYECYFNSGGNNMLKISEYNPKGSIDRTLKYNENGYLLEHIIEKGGKIVSYIRWDYKYDEQGNWIEATQNKVTVGKDITFEEEINTIIRKYEYYE